MLHVLKSGLPVLVLVLVLVLVPVLLYSTVVMFSTLGADARDFSALPNMPTLAYTKC